MLFIAFVLGFLCFPPIVFGLGIIYYKYQDIRGN